MHSDFCLLYCYIHNVSPDASFALLQVFHVKLRSLHGTSKRILYLIQVVGVIDCFNSVNHNQVQVLSYCKYSMLFTSSWDWTWNLQMISLRSILIISLYPLRLNKEFGSKFLVDSRVRHETPEEARRIQRPKRCEYEYEDNDNRPNTQNNKNHQASCQK